MNSIEILLTKYLLLEDELEAFTHAHSDVIDEYDRRINVLSDLEDRIKVLVKECAESVQQGNVRFVYVPSFTTTYDPTNLRQHLPNIASLPGMIHEAVDRTRLGKLITSGAIPENILNQIAVKEPSTPRVIIERKTNGQASRFRSYSSARGRRTHRTEQLHSRTVPE